MTVIAGVWCAGPEAERTSALRRMLNAQAIYARGVPVCSPAADVAMGSQGSVLPPKHSRSGGPVMIEGTGLMLVADLRLTNRPGLAESLGIGQAEARLLPDIQLVAQAWRKWRDETPDRLHGPFALAVMDIAAKTLVLARDPFGERPLYYHRSSGLTAFSSMPKGLLTLQQVTGRVSADVAAAFLALLPEAEAGSFFEGIDRVPAGHVVRITTGVEHRRRHWNPSLEPIRWQSHAMCVEAVRAELDAAVSRNLENIDVVATHLSAGLDSAAVTTSAARHLAELGGRVVALTAVPGKNFAPRLAETRIEDEGPLAGEVARRFGNVEHVLVRSEDWSPSRLFEQDRFIYDQPVLNPMNNGWHASINDVVKARGVTVLLTGTMGNLTFSHSGMERLPELLLTGRWLRLLAESRGHSAWTGQPFHRALALAILPVLPPWIRNRVSGRSAGWRKDVYGASAVNPARLDDLAFAARLRAQWRQFNPWSRGDARTRLAALRSFDVGNYYKGIAGGWGIDVRDPTADRRFVELCLRIPAEHFFRGGVPRALARDVLADRVPPALRNERRKGLQSADWSRKLHASRSEIAELLERLSQIPELEPLLDLQRLQGQVANWPDDAETGELDCSIGHSTLLRAVAVGHFVHRASGSNR